MKPKIEWQKGTVKKHGVNGLQAADVIKETIKHVTALNKEVCSEDNVLTIKALEIALEMQKKRDKDRKARKVEGTHKA